MAKVISPTALIDAKVMVTALPQLKTKSVSTRPIKPTITKEKPTSFEASLITKPPFLYNKNTLTSG